MDSFCSQVVVQEHILKAVWRKAAELLKEDGSIVEAPGGTGFLVKSNSDPPCHIKEKWPILSDIFSSSVGFVGCMWNHHVEHCVMI